MKQRQRFLAHRHHLLTVNDIGAFEIEMENFVDAHQRQGEGLLPHHDHQRRHDGECERHLDFDARALPRSRMNRDGAIELGDLGLDHVHAHATPGHIGDLVLGGKARHEDEFECGLCIQSRRIGRTFGLYDKALFHTRVTDMVWEEDKGVWRITTDRGDSFTADYIGMGTGPLHVPKLPGIPGIDTFKGHSFHTSRWDYDYTGGDTFGAPLDKLKDKRVAIIGTGATAVQCVPHLARAGGTVYVVQRTPSSIDVRANEPIDPEWFKTVATPGWQKRWLDNFARNVGMGGAAEDWVKDGWTDLTRRIRAKVMNLPPEQMNPAGMMAAYEDADIEKMSEIRARAEAIVEDKETAEKLKAWYRQLCKRPCFHDAYLQAFNEPNTHLIDTDGKGVERIDETGFWVGGKHYDVDCIIYASGFEVGTSHQRRAGFDIAGVGGKRLSEAWSDGMRTLHGLHVNGFPNAFVVQVAQAANYIVNVPHNWSDAGETIATIVRHAIDTGAKKVDVQPEAQKKWVDFVLTSPGGMAGIAPDCTPGYYNNEGKGYQESALFGAGHPAGAVAFFSYIDDWRKSGKFEGLTFN